ncbi:hypothetical protein BX600DRAFT_541316 [Xylariales sp. PMI_506]|nr:hypothetical protein BX600DRAFT_541316 [Xylariales sp. PMI_506]
MASNSQRIPDSEWNQHKAKIIFLLSKNPLKHVMNIMKHDHGFHASPSQYETRLQKWKVRKNISKNECIIILRELNGLKLRHITSRIILSGCPISDEHVQRALRNSPSKSVISMVSIEIKDSNGQWVEHNVSWKESHRAGNSQTASIGNRPYVPLILANKSMDTDPDGPGNNIVPSLSAVPQQYFKDYLQPVTQSGHLGSYRASSSSPEGSPPRNLPALNSTYSWSQGMSSSDNDIIRSLEPVDGLVLSELDYCVPVDLYMPLVEHLPTVAFIRSLTGRNPNFFSDQERSQALTSFRFKYCYDSFLEDVHVYGFHESRNQLGFESVLRSWKTLLVNDALSKGGINNLINSDLLMHEAGFNTFLLYAITNNFPGSNFVSMAAVIRYLERDLAATSKLVKTLYLHQNCMAKELIQKSFGTPYEPNILNKELDNSDSVLGPESYQKYGWSDDSHLTNELMLKGMLDLMLATERLIVPLYNRWKFEVQDLFQGAVRFGNAEAASLLLRNYRHIIDVNTTIVCKRCVYVNIKQATPRGSKFTLLEMAAHIHDQKLFKLLVEVVANLTKSHDGACFRKSKDLVDWALIEAAQKGNESVLQMLLPYAQDQHRIFSASIRGRNSNIIRTLQALGPELDAPAHYISAGMQIEPMRYNDHRIEWSNRWTTSLAEAIEAQNWNLVAELEDAGCLGQLHRGDRLEPVLHAAIRVNNVEYMRKLLHHRPWQADFNLVRGFRIAVETNNDAIFTELFEAGICDLPHYDGHLAETAIGEENLTMIRTLLRAGMMEEFWSPWSWKTISQGSHYERKHPILYKLISFGNLSLLKDLRRCYPWIKLHMASLERLQLDDPNDELLKYLVNAMWISLSDINHLLARAICEQKVDMVVYLLSLGGDPCDEVVLESAAASNQKMRKVLLESPKTRIQPLAGLKTRILWKAIDLGNAEAVDFLLDNNIVDIHGHALDIGLRHLSDNLWEDMCPIGIAVRKNNPRIVNRLLDAHCDPNSRITQRGQGVLTPLLLAIEQENLAMIQLLIGRGANINEPATFGIIRTPLQKAVETGNLDIVRLLVHAGAEVNGAPAYYRGATALQVAAVQGDCAMAAELLEMGARLDMPPAKVNGRWPLTGAAEHGRLDMIEFLWKSNNNSFDPIQAEVAMELASEQGHHMCHTLIKRLVGNPEAGANGGMNRTEQPPMNMEYITGVISN